jgi:hypothetical protein
VTAPDNSGRLFGTVANGGTIQIGGLGGLDIQGKPESTNAFVVVRPGAILDASGTSAMLDPTAGQTPSVRSVTPQMSAPLIRVSSDGGSISFDSETGIYLGGQLIAPAGGPGAQGGTLSIALVTPDYLDPGRFPGGLVPGLPAYLSPRELVIGTKVAPQPGVTQPGASFPGSAFGRAIVATAQIAAGGFDVVNLSSGDAILFDGSVALAAGRSINLSTAVLGNTGTSGMVSVSAPYVTLAGAGSAIKSGLTFQRGGDSGGVSPNWQPSAQVSQATLRVNAANIDVSGNLYVGVDAPVISVAQGITAPCPLVSCPVVDLPGFASTTLSSSGDIRFLPAAGQNTTLTTAGNLTLAAGQVYPVAGTNAIVTAGLSYDPANTVASFNDTLSYSGTLTIAASPGPVPPPPLTAFGELTLRAETIDQGGVLRAPDGQITLGGLTGGGQFAPRLNGNASTSRVILLPGSVTSISMNGLTIPFGGTSDGTTYTLNGAALSLTTVQPPQITLQAQAIQIQAGATIDVSGGGVLAGAGFVPGRGGSTDISQSPLLALTASRMVVAPLPATNLVFAIVPGFGAPVAPPTATVTQFTGPLPSPGDQIAIGPGVPGLPAGTYTLLPGSDALLPGAYRVELATAVHTILPGPLNLGNGSYVVNGYRGVANTGIQATRPIDVTVTPGANVRLDAQYDELSYANFVLGQAALFGQARAGLTLPADAKVLSFNIPAAIPVAGNIPATVPVAGLALSIKGTVASAPGPGGLGGIVELTAAAPIDVIANNAAPAPRTVSVLASQLSGLNANTLVLGGSIALNNLNGEEQFGSPAPSVTVHDGATLSAAQVFLVASGGITVEPGASVTTIGAGTPSINSSGGLTFNSANSTILAVSNGTLSFLPATGAGSISIGRCATSCASPANLLSEGTIATVTRGEVTLDSATHYGTSALDLSASIVNFGTPPAGTKGLTLSADTLRGLLAGDSASGVPALRQLTLTASDSVNFYGSFSLKTLDPVTGQSTLRSLQLNSPAIFGASGVNASLTTGTFVWNNLLNSDGTAAQPPGIWARGSGTAGSGLSISANTIVLGYGPADQAQNQISFDRTILGFNSVTLTASQSISGNNKGTLSVYQTGMQDRSGSLLTKSGGDLILSTPLLTGAPGSVITINAGGNLTIAAPTTPPAAGAVSAQGASLTLNAANVREDSAVVLPSGQLVMNALGSITLGGGSRLNLAGVTTTLFDQSSDGWGGDVTLRAATGGIMQAAGGTIDVSAGNANAGTVTALAPGVVNLGGTITGGAVPGFTSGSFTVRAGGLGSGFASLNASLDAGGLFGARSFELLTGDLTVGGGTTVRASTVTIAVDTGALTIAGTIDASGAVPGTIRLSSGGGLTLAAGAVLEAHGTAAQLDGYGQSIDSTNSASVTLTTVNGVLSIAPASDLPAPFINVAAAPGVTCALGACGRVTLNAPRLGGDAAGDIAVSVPVGVGIQGAGGIAVNAFRIYNNTSTITQTWFNQVPGAGATNFMNAAVGAVGATGALNATLSSKLAGLITSGTGEFHLRPGVEVDSPTSAGGLTVAGELDLSQFRFRSVGVANGPTEPGALVVRAGGILTVNGSINDPKSGSSMIANLGPIAEFCPYDTSKSRRGHSPGG